MKLFNWMQRRFHPTALKDGVAKNEEVDIITNNGSEGKQSMLKQVALVDVLDGWKDGILKIGTLGFDPFNPFTQHNEYSVLEGEDESDIDYNDQQHQNEPYLVDSNDDDEEEEEEEEEENPLIFTRFQDNYEEMRSYCETNSSEFNVPRKEKGERITLAELFMEDSDMKNKHGFDEFNETNKVAKKPPNNNLSFTKKKLIPRFKDDSHRPIKKIQQMVKRMLKRKIHPEVEGSEEVVGTVFSTSDSVSVLPTQLALATGPAI